MRQSLLRAIILCLVAGPAFAQGVTPVKPAPNAVFQIGANSSINLNQLGGSSLGATNPVPARLSDGTTFYKATTPSDTQPISAAALPLPTGAATAANQDGIVKDGTGDTTQANVTNGRLHVDGSGVTQPVSGTLAATQSGTWTMQPGNTANTTAWLFKLDQTTTNNDVDVASLPALPTGSNTIGGVNLTQYTPVSGRLPVDGSGVTQPVSIATNQPVGTVAHGSADSGSPIKIGCQARTTNRTAEVDGDRVDCVADKNGQIITTPMAPRERVVRSSVVTLTNTTETTLLAAGGAGVFRDLTYLKCTNTSATLVRVDLRDATAGTVIDTWALAASGGGFNIAFTTPYPQATANNNWTVQLSGSVTDVRCTCQAVEKN